MKIRTFIALEFLPIIREKLSLYTEPISGHDYLKQIQWLLKENYHLAMVFLGNIEIVLIKSLQLKLGQIYVPAKLFLLNFQKSLPFLFLVLLESLERCFRIRMNWHSFRIM